MLAVPKISISKKLEQAESYDPEREYGFRFKSKRHPEFPRVVKFSGGRSSGMMLFALLENGFLRRERGDVVVFNNTASEHPETYKFAAECKRRVESEYGVPFFFVQFQTYEDARQGEWRRIPSYRLVNGEPFSEDNPDGFQMSVCGRRGSKPEPTTCTRTRATRARTCLYAVPLANIGVTRGKYSTH